VSIFAKNPRASTPQATNVTTTTSKTTAILQTNTCLDRHSQFLAKELKFCVQTHDTRAPAGPASLADRLTLAWLDWPSLEYLII